MQNRIAHVLVMTVFIISLACQALAAETTKYTPPTLTDAMAVQKQGRYLGTITMDNGKKIELVLEGTYAPLTVANFVKLTQAKFYDGLTFHRIVENFVVQGGDPKGTGAGGPGYDINLEVSPFLRHKKGAISMAHTPEPDTAGSQFFITLADTPFLDGQYAVFGWVKSGMDVVEGIKMGDKMKTVTVAPYKGDEPNPIFSSGTTVEKPTPQ